jgi:hypothetical protein
MNNIKKTKKQKDVCRRQHENLELEYSKACDLGIIEHEVPFREYDYSLYYKEKDLPNEFTSKSDDNVVDQSMNDSDKPSVLLGIVLSVNRKRINDLINLKEEDITLKN